MLKNFFVSLPTKSFNYMKYLFSLLLVCTFLFAQAQKKEFRGVWIASVDNADWPAKGMINSDTQRATFIKMLDMHKRNGMNAVIVQVRPAADALYPSTLEPWSEWLTGMQGRAPNPYYDPLAFMLEETHKRGMEFHAWLNPYRAVFNIKKSSITSMHLTKQRPDWFITYGDKKYFDPGNKEAQKFVVSVVKDIVTRYKIDAIHMDDYFYPYRLPGKEFPDDRMYKLYGNGMNKDDWRRSNTDSIIVSIGKTIKQVNKKCRFGISPFGVWRNASVDSTGSNTKAGQTNYDDLYADILLWLRKGWIDYVAPQLYWEIDHKLCDYNILADWWAANSYGKDCYVGIGIYRANTNPAWKDKTQIPRQIKKLRSLPNLNGMIFFTSNTFNKNPNGWNDSLRLNYFKDSAGK
jgi:uncharacterized lipoprotein YddW (UPF0748 family)